MTITAKEVKQIYVQFCTVTAESSNVSLVCSLLQNTAISKREILQHARATLNG
jgi:hypothetical protein